MFLRVASIVFGSFCLLFSPHCPGEETVLPETWQQAWQNLAAENRPLQMVHSGYGADEDAARKIIAELQEWGLGGAVVNVGADHYLENEVEWKRFARFVQLAKEAGLRIWIYDEMGYPSPMAGGLVLRDRPDLEAQELVYDAATDTLTVRPSFEYTHASNNYSCIRRYPSLVNPEMTATFLRLTHEAYKKWLGPELFATVEAFFTDEPSSNVLNTGVIPVDLPNLKITDQPDPNKPNLPMVVWEDDFPQIYQEMYGEDLIAVRKSLFVGESDADRKVRRQFWRMVAQRETAGYYGPVRDWCRANGVASSGHTLNEEQLYNHAALDGDKLEVLRRMDIPGMDILTSEPTSVMHSSWRTASLPESAAILNGTRRILSEVSDIDTMIAKKPHVSTEKMLATAGWHAAFGVTEFALYYRWKERTAEEYRIYCEFVGRLNAILRTAQPTSHVVLYYPIQDIQTHYLPRKERTELWMMNGAIQKVAQSWFSLGQQLVQSQIPFFSVNADALATVLSYPATHPCHPTQLVIPKGAELTPEAQTAIKTFEQSGGTVFRDGTCPAPDALEPATQHLLRGVFQRDGQTIQVLVNLTEENYTGHLRTVAPGECWTLDPHTGQIERKMATEAGLEMALERLKTILVVQDSSAP